MLNIIKRKIMSQKIKKVKLKKKYKILKNQKKRYKMKWIH